MNKIKIIEVDGVEHVIIDRGNEEFTSMPKSFYEAQQVEHLTEMISYAPAVK